MTEPCSRCGASIQLNEQFCPRCRHDCGPPNVRQAEAQRAELVHRADQARARARNRGAHLAVTELERLLRGTRATVAMAPRMADHLLYSDSPLYATYFGLVTGSVRRPALPDDDKMRVMIEGSLYGTEGLGQVTYAALSPDDGGLESYGCLAASLSEEAIGHRATVLEQNSYDFFDRHRPSPSHPAPAGFVSTWPDRTELGVAKLATQLPKRAKTPQLNKMILHSDGDRSKDVFLEVHIWGPIHRSVVTGWRVMRTPPTRDERLLLKVVRKAAIGLSQGWSAP